MMRLALSLRDKKAEVFLPPFFVPTIGVAYRQLQDELKRPDSELAKHPDDYCVYQVGIWEDESGELVGKDGDSLAGFPQKLVEVSQLVESD